MKIRMTIDRDIFPDDNGVIVNFDQFEPMEDEPTHFGGYVRIMQNDEQKCFTVFVFNAAGDILSETDVPFKFIPVENI
jgi:hypothetical protein